LTQSARVPVAGDRRDRGPRTLDIHDPHAVSLYSVVKISARRNATWTLSNLRRGKPQPGFRSLVSPALELLQYLILSSDEEAVSDACWALSYLSDGSNEKIQAVIED
jgi:hypothetical protein